jgi:hypothetical protein
MSGLVIVIYFKKAEASCLAFTIDNKFDGQVAVLICEYFLRMKVIQQILYDLVLVILVIGIGIVILEYLLLITYNKGGIIPQAVEWYISYIVRKGAALCKDREA